MTKQEVMNLIKEYAEQFGFRTQKGYMNEIEIVDDSRTVNFAVLEHSKLYLGKGIADIKVTVSAAIASMGGNPTADDLMKKAKVIENAGKLVKMFDETPRLVYTISLEEE